MHWYESLDPVAALARPVETLAGPRPVILGEFPTRGASIGPQAILDLAQGAGYRAALAWSALATDGATDGLACRAALRAWSDRKAGAAAPA